MPDLYDAVGHGMWAYSNAAFRVHVYDRERFEPGPGTLVAVTHRRETDVPMIGPPLYFSLGGRSSTRRLHFAARDDMFLPGFFAGFPPDLRPRARRLLYRVGVGPWLPRVNVFPIRSASVARVGEVLAAAPDRPLGELLAEEQVEAFRQRAVSKGERPPARAEEVLRGEYADLLWQPTSPEDKKRSKLAGSKPRRRRRATFGAERLPEFDRITTRHPASRRRNSASAAPG